MMRQVSRPVRRGAGRKGHKDLARSLPNHYVQQYLPTVASSDSPLLGSSDVIESLIGKAKQRLDGSSSGNICLAYCESTG